jgi:hypothetical protein
MNKSAKFLLLKTLIELEAMAGARDEEITAPTPDVPLKQKNEWDNVHIFIPKSMRKGKTLEELQNMKKEIWEKNHKK